MIKGCSGNWYTRPMGDLDRPRWRMYKGNVGHDHGDYINVILMVPSDIEKPRKRNDASIVYVGTKGESELPMIKKTLLDEYKRLKGTIVADSVYLVREDCM